MGTKFASLILVCAPLLAHARPSQNAYLNHPVSSVSGLVSEIKHDPEVADRFMRHFGLSKSALIAMFSKLHVARLDRDTAVSMFSMPKDGAIKSHRTMLRKGEAVFEDADGNVVLKLSCGNPLVGGHGQTELALVPDVIETQSVLKPLPSIDVTPHSDDSIATVLTPDTPPDITVAIVPPENKAVENITNNYVTNNTYAGGGGGSNLGGLLIAVLIAAFLGTIIDHHGCGCTCPPPTPTPEPVSMTLLATGAIGLVVRRRRRRS